jgi:hypothetical protein
LLVNASEARLVPSYVYQAYTTNEHQCALFDGLENSRNDSANVVLTLGFKARQRKTPGQVVGAEQE